MPEQIVREILHPDGVLRVIVVRRADGRFTCREQERIDGEWGPAISLVTGTYLSPPLKPNPLILSSRRACRDGVAKDMMDEIRNRPPTPPSAPLNAAAGCSSALLGDRYLPVTAASCRSPMETIARDPEIDEVARLLVRAERPGKAKRINIMMDEGLTAR